MKADQIREFTGVGALERADLPGSELAIRRAARYDLDAAS